MPISSQLMGTKFVHENHEATVVKYIRTEDHIDASGFAYVEVFWLCKDSDGNEFETTLFNILTHRIF